MEHLRAEPESNTGGQPRRRAAYRAGWIALAVNVVLFGLKYWAGVVSGSLAIIADAWHTLSDSVTSLVVIAGTAVGARPADSKHPFGHERAEVIAALVIGILLAVLGFNFIAEGVEKLGDGTAAGFGTIAIAITALSVLAKEGLAQYAFHAARVSGNSSLRADGWHHRSDALSSVLILVGILFGRSFWWVDGVLALVVAALLLHAAWDVMWQSVSKLMGESPSDELLERIERISSEVVGRPANSHHVHLHTYGTVHEISFHIELPGDMSLGEGHRLATRIEDRLRVDAGVEATVHVEPEQDTSRGGHHRT
ncbi:MAG: cation diffusion facilitator family transporter [Spirochaetes bacterium]|jgi:cation diffusion facilitator family transporter|nr:cation diffusion facilitator family transporter [Spirochaetota bacterium]